MGHKIQKGDFRLKESAIHILSLRYLTDLGKKQADMTGQRLALLYSRYLQKIDENGNEVTSSFRLVKSTMTRATETANIILKQLPDIEHTDCDLIREGAPCVPDPPIGEIAKNNVSGIFEQNIVFFRKLESRTCRFLPRGSQD